MKRKSEHEIDLPSNHEVFNDPMIANSKKSIIKIPCHDPSIVVNIDKATKVFIRINDKYGLSLLTSSDLPHLIF